MIIIRIFVTYIVLIASASAQIEHLVESAGYVTDSDIGPIAIYPDTQSAPYPMDGVVLGQGWNSFAERKAPAICVNFSTSEAGGQTAEISVKRIHETDTLRKELDVSYGATAQAKFKSGGAGASAKTNFVKKSEVSNTYLSLLIAATVQNGVEFLRPPEDGNQVITLTSFADQLLNSDEEGGQRDDVSFVRNCGDSFVAAIERGAELYTLYQYTSAENEESIKRSTSIEASANYLAFSGSASTSRKEVKEAINKAHVTDLKYTHSAHRGLRIPYDEESIKSSISGLGSALELIDAFPYRIQTMRYDFLPSWRGERLQNGPAVRELIVAQYVRLHDLLASAEDAQLYPDKYDLTYGSDLVNASRMPDLLRKYINELEPILLACQELSEQDYSAALAEEATKCVSVGDDAQLTDYALRAAMPAPKDVLDTGVVKATAKEYDNMIAVAQNAYDSIGQNPFSNNLTCSKVPQMKVCRELAAEITRLKNEKNIRVMSATKFTLADKRYRHWIRDVAFARKESEMTTGLLSVPELAMYKRDIFCQYGIQIDSAPCPAKLLPELIVDGYPTIKTKEVVIPEIKSGQYDMNAPNAEIMAWQELQGLMTAWIADQVRGKPHYYTVDDSLYNRVETGTNVSFVFSGGADISYVDFAVEKFPFITLPTVERVSNQQRMTQ